MIGQPSATSARTPHGSKPSSDPSGSGDVASSHHHSSHAEASPPAAALTASPLHGGSDSAPSIHDEGPDEASVGGIGAGKPICAAGGADVVGDGIGGCCCGISRVGGRGSGGDGGQS